MDAEAVKECLENLVKVHDRAPSDLKIESMEAEGLTLTIHTTEPCPAIINYLGESRRSHYRHGIWDSGRRRICKRGRHRPLYCYRGYAHTDKTGKK